MARVCCLGLERTLVWAASLPLRIIYDNTLEKLDAQEAESARKHRSVEIAGAWGVCVVWNSGTPGLFLLSYFLLL